jgi:CRISPR-associated protein Csb2
MEGTLRIAVTLPGNRFHGDQWPSSPARLFRALLAGVMTGGYRDRWAEIEPALLWLEKQAAPEIEAVEAQKESSYRIAVPNNDMDVAAREWQAGRNFDATVLKTMKAVKPWKVDGPGPHLLYRWRKVQIDDATVTGLRAAAECLHTLGWGVDAAFASLLFGDEAEGEASGLVRWKPGARTGTNVSLPTEGSLADLQDAYGRFLKAVTRSDVNPDTRPMVFRQERYGKGAEEQQPLYFDLETLGQEVERIGKPKLFSYPSGLGMHVAAWMRHAVSKALLEEDYPEEWVNAEALGHGTAQARFSYVPMPSVGHKFAEGRIRRVMVTQESGCDPEIMSLLRKKLTGEILTDEHGKETCRLVAPLDSTTVRRSYEQSDKRWRSVTPVVLHGYNSQRGVISLKKTDKLLYQAFENSGWDLGNIERVAFQPAPFFRGTDGANQVRVPKHLDGWPRYHVAVDFRVPVKGPLLAGLGKYYGIGVFAGAVD